MIKALGLGIVVVGLLVLGCSRQQKTGTTLINAGDAGSVDGGNAEHTEAVANGLERANAQVAKGNAEHKWELGKGTTCDPNDLARPNAGKNLREPPGMGGCPAGMAPVASKPGVCIDRWEAHLVAILEDGTEQTWSPYVNPGTEARLRAKSAPLAVPQGYISQVQAATACSASRKRLCTDDEWIAACRGSAKTTFPYGSTERLGTCNDHRDSHPAEQYMQSSSAFGKLEHPCINQVPNSLFPTGAKKECVSPEGVFDMVGNLHEWTSADRGAFRGGYYVDTQQNLHGCDYVTSAHAKTYWDFSVGFRCCASTNDKDGGQ